MATTTAPPRRDGTVWDFLRRSGRRTYYKAPASGPGLYDYERAPFDDANLVSSLTQSGRHRPVLDLDVPHLWVPSSTDGHSHLYIEIEMSWWRYRLLLFVLKFTGIIGKGYYNMAVARRQTLVRMPGVHKSATGSWGDDVVVYTEDLTSSWGDSH